MDFNYKEISGFKLYYRGTWNDKLFAKCMAVVGSRRMTDYGRRVIDKIMPNLVQQGYTIISGFMYGVDQAAHRACVECGGKTIAVLGWGIDQRLETSDQELAEKIIQSGGLLVSLWQDQKGTLWTFPARNKVVAALAQEVIVVEAGLKSGSLLTADMALTLKKTVWAVPGPITSSVSAGTNMLIAEGKARPYLSSNISQYHPHNPPLNLRGGNPQERVILDLIRDEGLDASEIARKLGQDIASVGSQLTILVLKGEVEEREGKYYKLT